MGLFIDAKAADALRRYKYAGSDNSMTYKYVLSPIAQKCVDIFTPRSVAPNVITLVGFLFMIIAYIVMLLYAPSIDDGIMCNKSHEECLETGLIPRWVFLVNGLAMLLYQTFDNMDGKQAR